jgi:hypothetical protein
MRVNDREAGELATGMRCRHGIHRRMIPGRPGGGMSTVQLEFANAHCDQEESTWKARQEESTMTEATRRAAKEGIGFGLIAGILFAVVEVGATAMMGDPPIMPLRMFASVVLGREAMEPATPAQTAVVVGSVAHLALSALFGLIYGVIITRLSPETQTRSGRQAIVGLLYGTGLYLINIQVVARVLYPWFLEMPQLPSLAAHAVLFGLPLGLLFARAERRVYHVHPPAHA